MNRATIGLVALMALVWPALVHAQNDQPSRPDPDQYNDVEDGQALKLVSYALMPVGMVLDPRTARPELLARADFAERWNGRLILLTRRAALGDPARRFGIGWFAGADSRPHRGYQPGVAAREESHMVPYRVR